MVTRNRGNDIERDLRTGDPVPRDEEAKRPALLRGPAKQIDARNIRNNTISGRHIAPGSITDGHLSDGALLSDTTDGAGTVSGSGRFWRLMNGLLVCTHRLAVSGGTTQWTFPRAFGEAPVVMTTPLSIQPHNRHTGATNVGTSSADIQLRDSSGGNPSIDVWCYAIGLDS